MTAAELLAIADASYLSLTTFRKNGDAVATPSGSPATATPSAEVTACFVKKHCLQFCLSSWAEKLRRGGPKQSVVLRIQ